MKHDLNYLSHIKSEIEFLKSKSKDLTSATFLQDEVVKRAFVRSIEIIGEAAGKVSDRFKNKYPEVEWRKLSATRNHLIHGYFVVDYDIVWDLVVSKIPILDSQLTKILETEKTLFD
ncbi:HepT-like ribonuclease domain-containing protein [Leptospira sarikeiensis]|uniref:DUF86 domain-containing protein n=1 Tax=Leptospira sarikeiensis TaxID=2484943 RepID=A0A4V3JRZ6_9LEPT|nr:DUF86 domain-containing protein [Leptospira sarikeiensis]TGL62361.1 DUF86 domain-containing protein [Leptospira sarikeiensis]